jgi:hypothetical protein
LDLLNHFLCPIPMFAYRQVHMIRHDRASVAGVTAITDGVTNRISDKFKLGRRKSQQRMLERCFGLFIKIADFFPRGFHRFAAECSSPSSAIRSLRIVRDVDPRGSFGSHQP